MISQPSKTDSITLTVTNNVGSTHHCQLQPNEGVFVGKSSNCRVQLAGEGLSPIQCRIELDGGTVWVQDWMSESGTLVNGKAIDTKVELAETDVIQIGTHEIRLSNEQTVVNADKPSDETYPEHIAASPQQIAHLAAEQHADVNVHDETESLRNETISIPNDRLGAGTASSREEPAAEPLDVNPTPPLIDSESMDLDADFFDFEEEETYDRETVALLHAEIEDLQAALAQRDAERALSEQAPGPANSESIDANSDTMLQRMQQLIDEANRSDERVAILEEMLCAAEVASRSEQEERNQLEAWVGDIEKRIGQREDEHKAEINALRLRIKEAGNEQERLQKQLRLTAGGGRAPEHFEEALENLQSRNTELQTKFEECEKERATLERRLKQQAEEAERSLRDERVALAQEQAKVSRMRFELSNKLTDIEEIPKSDNQADNETSQKIRVLREHLREIHEQEKQEAKEASIATRLSKLWKRVEY